MCPEEFAGSGQAHKLPKRIFDVVLSSVGLVVMAPLILLIALAIKMESPGPILFRQRRIGLNGREFEVLRFRTMYINAEDLPITGHGHTKPDPRLTLIGRFLRWTALDESPQILNILRGEMSFVGPRAALPYEVKHYTEEQRKRLSCKPGLTGYRQVYGRRVMELSEAISLDLVYIKKQSIWLDLKLFCLSLWITFAGKWALEEPGDRASKPQ